VLSVDGVAQAVRLPLNGAVAAGAGEEAGFQGLEVSSWGRQGLPATPRRQHKLDHKEYATAPTVEPMAPKE